MKFLSTIKSNLDFVFYYPQFTISAFTILGLIPVPMGLFNILSPKLNFLFPFIGMAFGGVAHNIYKNYISDVGIKPGDKIKQENIKDLNKSIKVLSKIYEEKCPLVLISPDGITISKALKKFDTNKCDFSILKPTLIIDTFIFFINQYDNKAFKIILASIVNYKSNLILNYKSFDNMLSHSKQSMQADCHSPMNGHEIYKMMRNQANMIEHLEKTQKLFILRGSNMIFKDNLMKSNVYYETFKSRLTLDKQLTNTLINFLESADRTKFVINLPKWQLYYFNNKNYHKHNSDLTDIFNPLKSENVTLKNAHKEIQKVINENFFYITNVTNKNLPETFKYGNILSEIVKYLKLIDVVDPYMLEYKINYENLIDETIINIDEYSSLI